MKFDDFFEIGSNYGGYFCCTKDNRHKYLNTDGVVRHSYSADWFASKEAIYKAFEIWAANQQKTVSQPTEYMREVCVLAVSKGFNVSKAIQQVAFANGFKWVNSGTQTVKDVDNYPYLSISTSDEEPKLVASSRPYHKLIVSIEEFLAELSKPIEYSVFIDQEKVVREDNGLKYVGTRISAEQLNKMFMLYDAIYDPLMRINGYLPEYFVDGSVKIGCVSISKEKVEQIRKLLKKNE